MSITAVNADSPVERLAGSVERVTFHSEESGFCVLQTKVKGRRDLVTVIGNAASVTPGEFIECLGIWHNDKTHGLQFKAKHLKVVPPTTIEGIEKYLGSGMVKGIGPHFAKILVKAFAAEVFTIIETNPQAMQQLPGIGPKRIEKITSAWAEQKTIREIMVYLSHTASALLAPSASTRPTATQPSSRSRKIPTDWPWTFMASASKPPIPSPTVLVLHQIP